MSFVQLEIVFSVICPSLLDVSNSNADNIPFKHFFFLGLFSNLSESSLWVLIYSTPLKRGEVFSIFINSSTEILMLSIDFFIWVVVRIYWLLWTGWQTDSSLFAFVCCLRNQLWFYLVSQILRRQTITWKIYFNRNLWLSLRAKMTNWFPLIMSEWFFCCFDLGFCEPLGKSCAALIVRSIEHH